MLNTLAFHDARPARAHFLFDDFVLNVATRELSRSGRVLHAEPKVFDLLAELVQNRQRVVQRWELTAALWADTVVCKGALDQCVASLRRLLGESAREERYIHTVRRYGYRFIGRTLLLSHEG